MRDIGTRMLDWIGDRTISLADRSTWMQRWYQPVTASGLVLIVVAALFRMEASGADYDPQYMRVIVERTMRFGGSYYENGIHNKGPLEPFVYELAARIGGDDGFWFVIGVFAFVAALCVGTAAALFARRAGAPVVLASSVLAMAVVHLTLSEADYAGVLYARNMTVALLSVAFVVAAFDPAWTTPRRRTIAAVAVGVATGLAVQTLLTACFTASPVLLWAMWTRRDAVAMSFPAWIVMPVTSALALAAAPIYYLVLGPWRPFVDGWWVYARFMSTGTGRGLADQFGLGWDEFVAYYGDRPLLVVVAAVWVVSTVTGWRRLDGPGRSLRLLVLTWSVGAWIELILSQRYSSHYFSVVAAPTTMMIATLVGDVSRRWPRRVVRRPSYVLVPLFVAVATLFAGGQVPFGRGVEAAARTTSTADFAERRLAGIDGRTNLVRAALDLVSEEDDPLLMWTSVPWHYLNYERVSATRYIWKSFLLGEIYLGERGPEYVLPGTWDRFADDLDHTDPAAFVVESSNPVAPGTLFDERVDRDFAEVFADETLALSYRNDAARWLREPAVADERRSIGAGSVELAASGCVRFDGRISAAGLADSPIRLEFGTPSAGRIAGSISVSGTGEDTLLVESNQLGRAGYAAVITPAAVVSATDDDLTLSIVVGARSAVVVIDGRIAGAVAVADDDPVTLVSGGGSFTGEVAVASTLPSFTGC